MKERVWRAVACSVVAVLVTATPVRAEEAPRVRLVIDRCERLDDVAVNRIFSADLGASVTTESAPDVTEVTIECEGSRVVVRVRDPISRKNLRRSFDSRSFGDRGESRLIAIAASELVLASWAELAHNPTPDVEPEGPRPNAGTLAGARATLRARARPTPTPETEPAPRGTPPIAKGGETLDGDDGRDEPELIAPAERAPAERKAETPPPPSRFRAVAFGSARVMLSARGYLSGGGVRVGADRPSIVSWAADANLEVGKIQNVDVTNTSTGVFLFAHAAGRWTACRLGAGLRMGMLTIPRQATVATWGWPLGAASCSLFGGPMVIEIAAEGGYAVLQNRGTSQPALRASWAGFSLGLGLGP
jgi:hypothetical protein